MKFHRKRLTQTEMVLTLVMCCSMLPRAASNQYSLADITPLPTRDDFRQMTTYNTQQALREVWHEYEAQGVVGVMAEWKRSFWVEHFDVYNDTRYWVHK